MPERPEPTAATERKTACAYCGSKAREAMGIDWMTKDELNEAIPPAYTEYVGRQLLAHVREKVAV